MADTAIKVMRQRDGQVETFRFRNLTADCDKNQR
jgi:hypothetical protein